MIKLYHMIKVSENKQGGFTLIEIIVTLVIAAVVGTGLVQYLGTSLTKSSVPIQRLRQALDLQKVMENITADYRENYTSDLSGLSGEIGEGEGEKTNDYGTYFVVDNDFISFNQVGTSTTYNEDEVGTSPPTLLKVTIKNDLGDILTTLFSIQE